MQLKKLHPSFHLENSHLVETLDKLRGYGIVVISINKLTFGIPLRTKIKHKEAYITIRSHESGITGKGLDYSKAVLLFKPSYISSTSFMIPTNEHKILEGKVAYITDRFERYVQRYVKAVNTGDENTLREYRYSTLQNYHLELNICPPQPTEVSPTQSAEIHTIQPEAAGALPG